MPLLLVACSEATRNDTPGDAGGFAGAGVAVAGAGGMPSTGGSGAGYGAAGNGPGAGSSGSGGGAATGGAGGAGPSSSAGLDAVLAQDAFEVMFPNRNALYEYAALVEAARAYPAFAREGSLEERRREVAALLAHLAHETTGGWPTAPGGPEAWGLYFTEEVGCDSGACSQYCDSSNVRFPCQPGQTYHGRGPIQLSWNYNYGAAGEALGLDLLADPGRVARDGAVAFATALWFWMTPQPPKPSAHAALLGLWQPTSEDLAAGRGPGFGMTTNIINGGLECNRPTDDRVRDRLRFYRHFAALLGTSEGSDVECANMLPY